MVRITFLGTKGDENVTGTRLHHDNTAWLLESGKARILFDFGRNHHGELSHVKPTAIVISHAHADHVEGLKGEKVDVPVFMSKTTDGLLKEGYEGIADRHILKEGEPQKLDHLTVTAYHTQHSTRCPSVALKIETEDGIIGWVADVISIRLGQQFFKGLDVYVGDASYFHGGMVARAHGQLVGHTAATTQLEWLHKHGVKQAIFSHFGDWIVEAGEARARQMFHEAAPGAAIYLARDGSRFELVQGKLTLMERKTMSDSLLNLAQQARDVIKSLEELKAAKGSWPGGSGMPQHALVLTPKHARLVAEGKKKLIIKVLPINVGNELMLSDHEQAYGTLRLGPYKAISVAEFRRREAEHMITDEERKKLWPTARRLYAHEVVETKSFPEPKRWKTPKNDLLDLPRYKRELSDEEVEKLPVEVLKQTHGIRVIAEGLMSPMEVFAQRAPRLMPVTKPVLELLPRVPGVIKAIADEFAKLEKARPRGRNLYTPRDKGPVPAPQLPSPTISAQTMPPHSWSPTQATTRHRDDERIEPLPDVNIFVQVERLLQRLKETHAFLPPKTRLTAVTENAIKVLQEFSDLDAEMREGDSLLPTRDDPLKPYGMGSENRAPRSDLYHSESGEGSTLRVTEAELPTLKLPDPRFNIGRLHGKHDSGVLSRLERESREGEHQFLINELEPTKATAQYVWGVVILGKPERYEDLSKIPEDKRHGIDHFSLEEFSTESPVFYMELQLVAAYDPPLKLKQPVVSRRFGPKLSLSDALAKGELEKARGPGGAGGDSGGFIVGGPTSSDGPHSGPVSTSDTAPARLHQVQGSPEGSKLPAMTWRGLSPDKLRDLTVEELKRLLEEVNRVIEGQFTGDKTSLGGGISLEDATNARTFIEEELSRRGAAAEPHKESGGPGPSSAAAPGPEGLLHDSNHSQLGKGKDTEPPDVYIDRDGDLYYVECPVCGSERIQVLRGKDGQLGRPLGDDGRKGFVVVFQCKEGHRFSCDTEDGVHERSEPNWENWNVAKNPREYRDYNPETGESGHGHSKYVVVAPIQLSKASKLSYEEESKLIAENKKKPEAKARHKFQAADWTHPNGHPRCCVCGDEEPEGGYCNCISKGNIPLPDVRQATDYTCGVAALQAVLAFHGKDTREDELAEKLHATRPNGVTPERMVEVAEQYGVKARLEENLEADDLVKLVRAGHPVIVIVQAWAKDPHRSYQELWDEGHYMVLVGAVDDNFVFEDPAVLGRRVTMTEQELRDRWHARDRGRRYQNLGVVFYGHGAADHKPQDISDVEAEWRRNLSRHPALTPHPAAKGRYAPCHGSGVGDENAPLIKLDEVLPHFHDEFLIRSPFIHLVGGVVNNGQSQNDLDILIKGPLDDATAHVVKVRLGRMLPPELSSRVQFLGAGSKVPGDISSDAGPFASHIPLYDLVVRRREDSRAIIEMRDAGMLIDGEVELIEKADFNLKLPAHEGTFPAVVQYHFRGATVHADLRIKQGSALAGYTLAIQIAGKVPEIESLEQAKKIAAAFNREGSQYNKPLVNSRVYATPKQPEPEEWLRISAEEFKPGTVGATRNKRGYMVAVARPTVSRGTTEPYFQEWFLESDPKFFGILTFRMLVSSGKAAEDDKLEESGRRTPAGEAFYVAMINKSLLPSVVKHRAVQTGRIPPQGWSFLPPGLKSEVPKKWQYWLAKEEKERRGIRDELVHEGFFNETNIKMVDHRFKRVIVKYYVGKPVEPEVSDVPRAESGIAHEHQPARHASQDTGELAGQQAYFRDKPRTGLDDTDKALTRAPFTLTWQHWKGQVVIRSAPSKQLFHLFIKRRDGERGQKLMVEDFQLREDPSDGGPVGAVRQVFRNAGAAALMTYEGDAAPGKKIGGVVLNGTRNTPSTMTKMCSGQIELIQDDPSFKKFRLVGKDIPKGLQGELVLEAEKGSSTIWTLEQSRGPGEKRVEKKETIRTMTLAGGQKLADVQVWDPANIKPSDDKTHDRERLRPLAFYKPMKVAPRATNVFHSNELERLFKDFATDKLLEAGIVVEPKWNGFRASMQKDEKGRLLMISEDIWRDKSAPSNFLDHLPGLKAELAKLKGPFVIDGEFMAVTAEGSPVPRRELADFRSSSPSGDKNVRVHVFDILYASDKGNLMAKPLKERMPILKSFLSGHGLTRLVLTPHKVVKNKAECLKAIEWARKQPGSEGAMLKSAEATVTLRETDSMAKVKAIREIRGIVWDAHPVKDSPGVHNFMYAVGPISEKEKDEWAEPVEIKGKTYVKAGKTFNTKLSAKVGDVVRIEVTEMLLDESREKKRFRGFTPTVIDKIGQAPSSLKEIQELIDPSEIKKSEDEMISHIAKRMSSRFVILQKGKKDGEDERYVLGVVLEPETVDSQGDIYDAETIRQAAFYFMRQGHILGLMHKSLLRNDQYEVLESYLAPVDFELEGQHVKKGTWMLGAHILDDQLWLDIKEGKLTGWSIEGSALVEELAA